ncbi:DUF3455 domain-containing protein [Phreatobacter stygius]|uniref:DUF3455 domain-containing protein n=1 Tax=Phreatobacter stygius TaxID=1940610 RepID=A0A4D7ATJ0_9HYPH|nr:DUF3455 domain-containing protein [Phreatobacter stygius]QCI62895.1 DUF3455 domain-containing protein [Phreatobacter stygius]
MNRFRQLLLAGASLALAGPAIAQTLPAEVGADQNEVEITTVHAEGVQVYECKAGASGQLTWQFREPVATLIRDGQTVGRHYAGPRWEFADGSLVEGRVSGRAPGTRPNDIPILKLSVVERRGTGALSDASSVQRLKTVGGVATGACERAGSFRSVPYTSDYVFLRRR